MASSSSSGVKKNIDVLVVGFDVDNEHCRTRHERLIKQAGGEHHVNVKMVKDRASVDFSVIDSFDLVVLDEKVGLEMVVDLRLRGVPSMIVVVSSSECVCSKNDERRDWINAGAHEFLGKPLNDEKMRSVFNQLKTGIENGSFKKPFKVLTVDTDFFPVVFKKTGVRISLRQSDADQEAISEVIRSGITFDLIFISKARAVVALREGGVNSMMVGVTYSEKERLALRAAGVNQFVPPPLTMASIDSIIEQLPK